MGGSPEHVAALACLLLLSAKIFWLEDDEELDARSLFYVVYI